jgi:hypothetical protein
MIFRSSVGDGVNVIAAPDADPNVTDPPLDRVFGLPSPFPSGGSPTTWLAAEGGAPTVEIWALLRFGVVPNNTARWFRWNNATFSVPAADQVVQVSPGVPVDFAAYFLRITAVGGATRVTFGLSA